MKAKGTPYHDGIVCCDDGSKPTYRTYSNRLTIFAHTLGVAMVTRAMHYIKSPS